MAASLNSYWQLQGDLSSVWSGTSLSYVSTTDPTYQAFLQAGGTTFSISDMDSLSSVIISLILPLYFATGLQIISTSNTNLNSTYALDNVTIGQVGTVARDSASGLGLPLELSTFTYPDINGLPQAFTAVEIQGLYIAMRDYIAGTTLSVNALIHKLPGSLPTQPVTIP
jgi:hypothetical protein